MARIRSIHPSFFTDEAVVSCSPLARLLYVGLWTDADDQGLFEWRPLQIKMRLLPGDSADASELLGELVAAGLIAEFSTGEKRFGAIRDFRTYQRPKKPNAVHVLPPEWRTYVGLGEAISELATASPLNSSEPVPHQFPTRGENPPQMEDGGEDVGSKKDATASSVLAEPKTTKAPSRKSKTVGPEPFEAAWKAYPHVEGRSSKPNALAEWKKLGDDEQTGLLAAVQRFAPKVGQAHGDKGAPCMARWLRDGKHLNWMAPAGTGPVLEFDGPPALLASVIRATSEDFAQKWVKPCHWREADRTLVARNSFSAKQLTTQLAAWLAKNDVRVEVAAEPGREAA